MLILYTLLACNSPEVIEPSPEPVEYPAPEPAPDEPPPKRDHPPVIKSLKLLPEKPHLGDDLQVLVEAEDPDGDYVDVRYQWFVDGEEVLGEHDDRLLANFVKRGQKVRVQVQAKNQDFVASGRAQAVIYNAAPEFTTRPDQMTSIDGFQLRARDPDGDPLTWSISGGPPSLTIDGRGRLKYKGSKSDPAGSYDVKVKVEDGFGGFASWGFPVTVEAGSNPD